MKTLMLALLFMGLNPKADNLVTDNCALLKEIFLNKEVAEFLHTNSEGRDILYVVKNNLCNSDIDISKSLKVVSVEQKDISNKKNYLKIMDVETTKSGMTIIMEYPIEGAEFTITLDSNNKIINVGIIEF